MDTTLYFPIGFNTTLTLIGVGFVIGGAGQQSVIFTSTSLTTDSAIDFGQTSTNSYLAIGI